MSQNTTKKVSKNILLRTMNTISSNEIILVLNPNSQGGETGTNCVGTATDGKDFLPKEHKIIFTKKTNDGIILTRKLLRKGYRNIVDIGGDDTINEVANGFFDLKLQDKRSKDFVKLNLDSKLKQINPNGIMYIVPSGSRNVMARSLEIKHQGSESLIRIKQMKKRKMDVIAAVITDKDDPSIFHNRIIMNAAEIGVGAEIIDRSKKVRGKIKNRFVSTVASIIATLPAYSSNECDIIID